MNFKKNRSAQREPASLLMALVFVDGTLCIYDTTTGEAILPPFKLDEIPRMAKLFGY
jgi:hypothetical protein